MGELFERQQKVFFNCSCRVCGELDSAGGKTDNADEIRLVMSARDFAQIHSETEGHFHAGWKVSIHGQAKKDLNPQNL